MRYLTTSNISKSAFAFSCLYGALCAFMINFRISNYLWIVLGIIILHILAAGPVFVLRSIDGERRRHPLLEALSSLMLPLLIILIFVGVGTGIFVLRMHAIVRWVDSKRQEIAASLLTGQHEVNGIYFSPLLKNGSMDIEPCWSNNVIVYFKDNEYSVVLPLNRPLPFSISSFDVLIWDKETGWRKDKIHWMIQRID